MKRSMVMAAAFASFAIGAFAEDAGLQIQPGDTVKSVLDSSVGQTVAVRAGAGEELRGKVVKVGDHVVQLSELSGREFFDAVVPIDSISAVIVKARGR